MKNNQPNISLIRKYLNGELDATAMYKLERQAQEDPLLMDMIQGMETGNRETDEANIVQIDTLINERVNGGLKIRKTIAWKGWLVAASLVLISTTAGLWIFKVPQQNKLQQKQAEQARTAKDKSAPRKPDTITEASINAQSLVSKNRKVPVPKRVKAENAGMPDSAITTGLAKTLSQASSDKDLTLSEVVITGYPVQRKPVTTSAVTIQKNKPDTLSAGLAGKVAGVSVNAAVRPKSFDDQALNEVVVTKAYGVKKRSAPSTERATVPSAMPVKLGKIHPVIGWDAFRRYLKDNAAVPDGSTGNITVAFLVESDGSPVHVIVIKGLNEEAGRKAIELIRNGPKWLGDEEEMAKMITVKIKFH